MKQIELPKTLEHWPIGNLLPYARNARFHSDDQILQIVASIERFGWTNPVLVSAAGVIIAGHARVLAARQLQLETVPVIVLGNLTKEEQRALVIADNKLALNAGWDEAILREELLAIEQSGFEMALLGFSDEEIRELMDEGTGEKPTAAEDAPEDATPEAPQNPVTRSGDVWAIGRHRLICGDCRNQDLVRLLLAGRAVNVTITSPPYASQREYDPASGFKAIPVQGYVRWFKPVGENIAAFLASDGSYFLNIKPHAENGERSLYVMDLVIAHKRKWGWMFVDDLLWRKIDNGVPGGWPNRFKNAHEPVFHFTRQSDIKFHPLAVGHASDDCFDYSPENPKSTSGSGLLGTGARGSGAGKPGASDEDGRFTGVARPSNVIECKSESTQGSHSAPYPRRLVEFFVKAFSDEGDVIFDPFMGSGTTMAEAHAQNRDGYGCEISPAYCDVILGRIHNLAGQEPVLLATGQTFAQVAAERGIEVLRKAS